MFYGPINSLPIKCDACGFPDLDHVPQPYYLVKSRTMSPNEILPAENGNFFVRGRIRKVLELLAPHECDFFSTCYKGTAEQTPWFLAVPNHQVVTAKVDPSIIRCDACGEPRSAHPGSQFIEDLWNYDSDHEIIQSSTWSSSEIGWDKWIDRHLFFSVRLFWLLKQIKAKGLDEATCGKKTSPNKEEADWIDKQLVLLVNHGIPLHSPGSLSNGDTTWFRKYLKDNATKQKPSTDWKALEKQFKFKLPKSYKDFINKSGPRSFSNVDEQEGFNVHLLQPQKIDFKSYRAGALEIDDEETSSIDAVLFAHTDHGDCFCFDIRKDRKEFEVFLYLHEYNYFEPYAPNFVACIKRFVIAGNDV